MAFWFEAITAAAVALNVAVVAAAATTTEAGTVNSALFDASATEFPPASAGWVRVTVQLLTALCPRLAGLQLSADTAGTVITPLAPVATARLAAVASAPMALVRAIVVVRAFGASVAWIVAATPEAIALTFIPARMHVIVPGPEAHVRVFPAAVATGPAKPPMAEIWFAGYARVHSRAAGASPEVVNERFRTTVDPGAATADDRFRPV